MTDQKLLISKIEDLRHGCIKKYYPEFSKFLDMTQQTAIKNIKAPGCNYFSFGGYEDADRKVIGCFPDDFDYSGELFPISCLKIVPSDAEGLTHRDYLGSLIGLGITRDSLGDIVLTETFAYCFCLESISDFIVYNLERIGSRTVKVEKAEEIHIPEKTFKRISGTAASNRTDCVLAFCMGTSRGKVEEIIKAGRVMVNYVRQDSASAKLKAGDVVSVRGFGKFIYVGDTGETKKGRLKIEIDLYN